MICRHCPFESSNMWQYPPYFRNTAPSVLFFAHRQRLCSRLGDILEDAVAQHEIFDIRV